MQSYATMRLKLSIIHQRIEIRHFIFIGKIGVPLYQK